MNAFAYLQIALCSAPLYLYLLQLWQRQLYLYLSIVVVVVVVGRVACVHWRWAGGGRELGATSFAFYAAFGMFIVNLLNAILSHKQMLHFTSASSRGLKTALINELQLQLELLPWICICICSGAAGVKLVPSWGCARALIGADFDFEWVRLSTRFALVSLACR